MELELGLQHGPFHEDAQTRGAARVRSDGTLDNRLDGGSRNQAGGPELQDS